MDEETGISFKGINTKFDSLNIEVQNNNSTIKLIRNDISILKPDVKSILEKLTKIKVHTGEIVKNSPTLTHIEHNDEFRFHR